MHYNIEAGHTLGVDSTNNDLTRRKADILKALGHPTRISIIEYLRRGERCVCEIFPALEMEQSNISQHLAILKKNGILDSRKDGLRVIYWIKSPEALQILDLLHGGIIRSALDSAAAMARLDTRTGDRPVTKGEN